MGHDISDCSRDPNFKTNKDPEIEYERISRSKYFRKLFSDTIIMTAHFLKKLVKIPKARALTKD